MDAPPRTQTIFEKRSSHRSEDSNTLVDEKTVLIQTKANSYLNVSPNIYAIIHHLCSVLTQVRFILLKTYRLIDQIKRYPLRKNRYPLALIVR